MMSTIEKVVLNELLRVPGIAEAIGKNRAAKLESRANERIKILDEIDCIEPELSAKQAELGEAKEALQLEQKQVKKMIDRLADNVARIEQECQALSSKLHHATNTLNREYKEGDVNTAITRLEAEIQNRRRWAEALAKSINSPHPFLPSQYALNPQQRIEKSRLKNQHEQKITVLEGALSDVIKLRRARVSPDYITEAVAAALSVIEGN